MTTRIYIPSGCELHDPAPGHPEQPARIEAIRQRFAQEPIPDTELDTHGVLLPIEAAVQGHHAAYIEQLQFIAPRHGIAALDGDTQMDQNSLTTALLAAGTLSAAVESVCSGDVDNAFCAVRPPGHHAEAASGMGFCLLNSIALAAIHALDTVGLERVAILDFDVHHGNGTEDCVKHRDDILFCSAFQHPWYPGVNSPSIKGQRVNVPLPDGTRGDAYREALEHSWWPELDAFKPDLILVSAGFDAHRLDPLGGFMLETEDFRWLANKINDAATRSSGHRVVAALEGGYNLSALADSVHLYTTAMAGH